MDFFRSNIDNALAIPWSPALCKPLLLFVTAISVHVSLSPPNPPVKSEECCSGTEGTDTLFEKLVQSITWCSKCMVWICTVCDSIALVASGLQGNWIFDANARLSSCNSPVHPAMVLGAIITVVATVLRMWCFKALGPFFTFEITIRPKHELITGGPYSRVRHPSYTGVYLTLIGATLALGAPGTWMADYGIWTIPGAVYACIWLIKCAFAFRGMCVRLKAEDEVLRETFGSEWEEYSRRVPYKFIPGVV